MRKQRESADRQQLFSYLGAAILLRGMDVTGSNRQVCGMHTEGTMFRQCNYGVWGMLDAGGFGDNEGVQAAAGTIDTLRYFIMLFMCLIPCASYLFREDSGNTVTIYDYPTISGWEVLLSLIVKKWILKNDQPKILDINRNGRLILKKAANPKMMPSRLTQLANPSSHFLLREGADAELAMEMSGGPPSCQTDHQQIDVVIVFLVSSAWLLITCFFLFIFKAICA